MAYFTVRHSLNPSKVIRIGITYRKIVAKADQDGELIWVLEVATDEPDINGDEIQPYFIHLTDELDMDDEIKKAVAYISNQVDWEPLADDGRAPYVDSVDPSTYIADIWSNVVFNLKEIFPSAGIDQSSIKMFVNDEEVTDDLVITGDVYDYTITWSPPGRLFVTEP